MSLYDYDEDDKRERARAAKLRTEGSIKHIRNYYGLAVSIGLRVEHSGRPGSIVGFEGQYIKVLLDGEEDPIVCHATSSMEYPPGVHVGPGPDERFAHLVEVPTS